MENIYRLKNIIKNLTIAVKKQDFLVYFRKMSIVEYTSNEIIFGVESGFMKNNLEAKFKKEILAAAILEDSDITNVELIVDDDIDIPSNSKVVDCTKFYKEATRTLKNTNNVGSESGPNTKRRSINERYTLDKFIV
jgi:chromosomal replication initiation ATPase DnaA